jgi:putative membrane protein
MRWTLAPTVGLILVMTTGSRFSPGLAGLGPSSSDLVHPGSPSSVSDDPTILGVIEYAHTSGLESAEVAQRQGHAAEVRELAQSFARAHTHARDEVRALGTRLQIRPVLPDADPLPPAQAQAMTRLQGLVGSAFDKAWADHQVLFHQTLIERVRTSLIPSAGNQHLKGYLNRVLPALVVHLEEARALQERVIAIR